MLSLCLLSLTACGGREPQAQIVVDFSAEGHQISERLYGVFIEDINRAGDGRLYAEMVLNRSFEDAVVPCGYEVQGETLVSPSTYNHVTEQWVTVNNRWNPDPVPGWKLLADEDGHASMRIEDDRPNFSSAPHYLHIVSDGRAGAIVLNNSGYGGYGVEAKSLYHLRVIARTPAETCPITVRLLDEDDNLLGQKELTLAQPGEWTDMRAELLSDGGAEHGRLELALPDDWAGELDLDYVSLMPDDTYHHRPNGMRRDVAEAIEALHPTFVRWPGGCVVEGITLETRFKWKEAMGDPAARPGIYNLWGYRNSCGLGWQEMLQFCEDLGAAAMYVCNVGMACQAQTSELAPDNEVKSYLQDCLDAIEYAIGDVSTPWGARRSADGHDAPYRLEYVEIGNENWGPKYDERYQLFYDAIHARYPQLTLISDYGIDAMNGERKVDVIDPHWYVAPAFFFNNTSLFDSLPRTGPDIYVGEYACNSSVGSGNMEAALSEAAFLLGIERNADLVKMCSYAPLLESDWYRAWPTNLIWVSPTQVMKRSSYYVQQMMAEHRPTRSLPISMTASQPELQSYPKGRLGLGCWKSQVEYRNARLSVNGAPAKTFTLDGGTTYVGEWKSEEGVLKQVEITPRCKYLFPRLDAETYTLELQARKVAGKDAFIVFFGMDELGEEGYYYSVGGQNNSKACVEKMHLGENSGQDGDITSFHAEMNQWYDLRIEVTPHESRLYVDEKLLITHHPLTYSQQAYTAGYDDERGELVLKAVNASSEPWSVSYRLEGLAKDRNVDSRGTAFSLSADALTDENSFADPMYIAPRKSTFEAGSERIDYTFAPYSFTILRLPM